VCRVPLASGWGASILRIPEATVGETTRIAAAVTRVSDGHFYRVDVGPRTVLVVRTLQ
jgi:hypothetical protein